MISISGKKFNITNSNSSNGGGISAMQNSILGSLIDTPYNPLVTRFQMISSAQDILALSVCWRKLRTSNDTTSRPYVNSLLDPELFKIVTQEDIEQANKIRDYYSKKLMLITLKSDVPLSKFRKDLSTFISSEGKVFREDMVPLVFRLPEFYEYDIKLESTIEKARNLDVSLNNHEHVFLSKLSRTLKKNTFCEYWFLGTNQYLACLTVDNKNILIPILDKVLQNKSGIIDLPGNHQPQVRDGLHYYKITRLY